MRRAILLVAALLFVVSATRAQDDEAPAVITSSSKTFTESVILGEMARQLADLQGYEGRHQAELGGTRIVYEALKAGEVDVYAEYTGTLLRETLANQELETLEELRAALEAEGLGMTDPLGFNNTYGIGVRRAIAEARDLRTISDLADHPDLRARIGHEFLERADGWNAMTRFYGIELDDVAAVDHDLGYKALETGAGDVIDVYTTDAEVAAYDLVVLDDDRNFFPVYDAIFLYRLQLRADAPDYVDALNAMSGSIDAETMQGLNKQAKIDGEPESRVAARFLREYLELDIARQDVETLSERLIDRTLEHLRLVALSMIPAAIIAVPLGVLAARTPLLGQIILATAGIVQTVPSLALLALMIPLFGTGVVPAVVALALYSLLVLIRNTHAGLTSIPPTIEESAEALGLSDWRRLLKVELPLAMPSILTGVKTALVINVGFATLGAFIGAGGYGRPILSGIRLDRASLILEGVIPAALMAILAVALIGAIERLVVSKGLRLRRTS